MSLNLKDGWRQTNPLPETRFTFSHNSGTYMSCIDHIYTSERIMNKAYKWDINLPGLPTVDHQLIMVEIHDNSAPGIGRGRWKIQSS